jgi:hypothetical protein
MAMPAILWQISAPNIQERTRMHLGNWLTRIYQLTPRAIQKRYKAAVRILLFDMANQETAEAQSA